MILNYDEHSTDIVDIGYAKVSIHDLVCYYNQIQIMKKEGTYSKDFEYTFDGTAEIKEND